MQILPVVSVEARKRYRDMRREREITFKALVLLQLEIKSSDPIVYSEEVNSTRQNSYTWCLMSWNLHTNAKYTGLSFKVYQKFPKTPKISCSSLLLLNNNKSHELEISWKFHSILTDCGKCGSVLALKEIEH